MSITDKLIIVADNTPAVAEAVNAAKATVSGAVVRVDDVLDVEHRLGVKLKSKNLIPLDSLSATSTINGITFTNNGDGTFTLNGTATAEAIYGLVVARNAFPVYKGKTYAFSGAISKAIWLQAKYVETDSFTKYDYGSGCAFTADDNYSFRANIRVNEGTVCENVIVKPQLEEGATATEYAPYNVELLGTEVSVYGKNLFDYRDFIEFVNSGVGTQGVEDATYKGEDCFAFAATQTSNDDKYTGIRFKENTQYTITIEYCYEYSSAVAINPFLIWYTDGTFSRVGANASISEFTKVTTTTVAGKTIAGITITRFAANATVYVKKDMQIEISTAATAFEPYKAPQTATADASGKVVGLTSVSPTMTLIADNDVVALECTYFPASAADTVAKYQRLKAEETTLQEHLREYKEESV